MYAQPEALQHRLFTDQVNKQKCYHLGINQDTFYRIEITTPTTVLLRTTLIPRQLNQTE